MAEETDSTVWRRRSTDTWVEVSKIWAPIVGSLVTILSIWVTFIIQHDKGEERDVQIHQIETKVDAAKEKVAEINQKVDVGVAATQQVETKIDDAKTKVEVINKKVDAAKIEIQRQTGEIKSILGEGR